MLFFNYWGGAGDMVCPDADCFSLHSAVLIRLPLQPTRISRTLVAMIEIAQGANAEIQNPANFGNTLGLLIVGAKVSNDANDAKFNFDDFSGVCQQQHGHHVNHTNR